MNLYRIKWKRCYYNFLINYFDRCLRKSIHFSLPAKNLEHCVLELRYKLSPTSVPQVGLGRLQNLRSFPDTAILSRLGAGNPSVSHFHSSSSQFSDGNLPYSRASLSSQGTSSSSETRGGSNSPVPLHPLSKNSDLHSCETEARNFSTITAQKIERETELSSPVQEAYSTGKGNSNSISSTQHRTSDKTLHSKESLDTKKASDEVLHKKENPSKMRDKKKESSQNLKKAGKADSLTYKNIESKAKSKVKKQRTTDAESLQNSEKKMKKISTDKPNADKKTKTKEVSSSSKSKQRSKVISKQTSDGITTKEKRTLTDKVTPTNNRTTSAVSVKSRPKHKLSTAVIKSSSSSKSKNKPTSSKSQERKLVLLVPEIPPSKLSNDLSKMLVFLRRMYIAKPIEMRNQPKIGRHPSSLSFQNVESSIRKLETGKETTGNIANGHIQESQIRGSDSMMITSKESGDRSHDHGIALSRQSVSGKTDDVKGVASVTSEVTDQEAGVAKIEESLSDQRIETCRPEENTVVTGKKKKNKKSSAGKASRIKQPHEDPHQYVIPLLDLCVYQGKMQYAQAVFDTCMQHGKFQDLEVYNSLLKGWADKGNMNAVQKLFSLMTESGVQPDLNSFVFALECLGRSPPLDRELAERVIGDFEQTGMTLDDIMLQHIFRRDSREVVLKVIQDIRPEFKHPQPPIQPVCSLEVVKELYTEPMASPATSLKPPLFGILSKDEMRKRLDLQWETEERECINIKSVEEELHPTQQVLEKRKILAEHQGMWWRGLKKGLQAQKKKHSSKTAVGHTKEHIYPFMTILNDDEYIQLMLDALPKFASTSEGIGTLHLARDLGSKVNQRYIIRKKRKNFVAQKTKNIYWEYIQGLLEEDQEDKWTHRENWQHLLHSNQNGPSLDFDTHIWPSNVTLKVGNFMADILLREIQIDANLCTGKQEQKLIPGLYHMYTYRSMKQVGFIKPHPLLIDLFQGAKDPNLPFDSNILPMLTPPLPWTSARFGGYPLSATKLMRCKEGSLQSQLIEEKAQTAELNPVLDSLNQLGSVPWIVNKKMLDIIIDIFKKGGSKDLDIPQPSSVYPSPPPITSDATPEEIAKIHQERAAMRKCQAEMHSLRMDMLYKLSIANHFRNDTLWFPHNMDFRGRVYPCPPHFNHLGSDVTRSLLLFAIGKPLGKKGLDWLKIHLINLSGLKKRCSLEDRLAYANEILTDILDSADKPFEGKKWWQQTDEPWQALACCMEIAEATRSPNHEKFISHLPVHQDGSCNGLQHYAALGRDVIGAQQVNLHPFPVPQDVYSGVAQMVEEMRVKDAENGVKVAKALEGSIHRKVVKQTVMTVVYGVTAYGGRHQIFRQLKDMEILSENDAWYAAGYLVLKVFQSLGKMFAKTREIQDWLTESALMIARGGSSVEWVTPLGLPIVQPYHKKSQMWVTSTRNWSLYHNDTTNPKGRPDAQKQKNAFPPNFIHSLDSTHMMLTSLHCQRSGVTFASVHDCFWTHPCTVDLMNKICREQFVRLHEQPILHDLAKNLVEKFGEIDVAPGMRLKHSDPMDVLRVKDYLKKVPETGEFDLKNVSNSTYFFS